MKKIIFIILTIFFGSFLAFSGYAHVEKAYVGKQNTIYVVVDTKKSLFLNTESQVFYLKSKDIFNNEIRVFEIDNISRKGRFAIFATACPKNLRPSRFYLQASGKTRKVVSSYFDLESLPALKSVNSASGMTC